MKLFPVVVLSSSLVVGVAVYLFASGGIAAADAAAARPIEPGTLVNPRPQSHLSVAGSVVPQPVTPPGKQGWAADVASTDAHRRAEAIGALAGAPSADALPILESVLSSGELIIDRPLALRSLRDIAVRDGDADGAIRDMMRRAAHQTDNQEFSRQAQAAVDDLEMLLEAR